MEPCANCNIEFLPRLVIHRSTRLKPIITYSKSEFTEKEFLSFLDNLLELKDLVRNTEFVTVIKGIKHDNSFEYSAI